MIIGETPEQRESREEREELMANDWVSQHVDQETAAKHGTLLVRLLITDIYADDAAQLGLIEYREGFMPRRRSEDEIDVKIRQDVGAQGFRNWMIYKGKGEPGETSSNSYINQYRELVDTLLSTVADPEESCRLLDVIDSAKQGSAVIKRENWPGLIL